MRGYSNFCSTLLLLCSTSFASPIRAQDTNQLEALELSGLADDDFVRYSRSLFPIDADPANPKAVPTLSAGEKAAAASLLVERVDRLVEVANANRESIHTMMAELGVKTEAIRFASSVPVAIVDGTDPVAALSGSGRIVVNATTLRGFLIGSLEEGVRGQSGEGMMVRLALGWDDFDLQSPTAEWTERFVSLLTLFEVVEDVTVTPQQQLDTIPSLFAQPGDENYVPNRFEQLVQQVLFEGRAPTPSEAYLLFMAHMFLSSSLIGPSETFLLAHELGHLALGHKPQVDCALGAAQERDADAFAIALLVYDNLGGDIDAMFFAYAPAGPTAREFVEQAGEDFDLRRAKYGFVQAFKYGMANAGMGRGTEGPCPFVTGEQRLSSADSMWKDALGKRLLALSPVAEVLRKRPAAVGIRPSDTLLSNDERAQLVESVRAQCNGAPARLVRSAGDYLPNQDRYVYFVKCGWPTPAESDYPEHSRRLMGVQFLRNLLETYRDLPTSVVEYY